MGLSSEPAPPDSGDYASGRQPPRPPKPYIPRSFEGLRRMFRPRRALRDASPPIAGEGGSIPVWIQAPKVRQRPAARGALGLQAYRR